MPGQVEREHAVAVVREVAGFQDPHAVVALGAMAEDHGGKRRIEGLAGRCRRRLSCP